MVFDKCIKNQGRYSLEMDGQKAFNYFSKTIILSSVVKCQYKTSTNHHNQSLV